MSDITRDRVCEELSRIGEKQDAKGIKKYGKALTAETLTPEEAIEYALEELYDAMAYVLALKDRIKPEARSMEDVPKDMDTRCWVCRKPTVEMFSWEFDTFVHEACLRERLKDPDDPEAPIMARELLEDYNAPKK